MTQQIEPPDLHFLSAAIGWLELGNASEAAAELQRIGPTLQSHPHVLQVCWQIASKNKEWQECVKIAKQLTEVDPEDSFGWIHLSFSLHELKRTHEAYENLISVSDQFPKDWLVRYNLACYSAQLGDLTEAKSWLKRAMELGDRKVVKSMAMEDADLLPLRGELNSL